MGSVTGFRVFRTFPNMILKNQNFHLLISCPAVIAIVTSRRLIYSADVAGSSKNSFADFIPSLFMTFAPRALARVGYYRWTICALLFFATTINYMDRQILGLLAPTLQKEFGWNEIEYGHLVTAFQGAYALGLLIFGRLIDRIGTKIGYIGCIVIWSLAAMGHALAKSVLGFGVARFALGLGESGNFPAAIKTVAEWFPPKERALATGIFNCGSNAGAIVAPIVVPWLALAYGWRASFIALGALGFIWIVFWIIFYDRPRLSSRVGAMELVYIDPRQAEPSLKPVPWRRLLRERATWAYLVNCLFTSPVWWFYLYWLPKFLAKRYSLDLVDMGPPLVAIYTAACFGSIGGGWLSSHLISLGWTPNGARKTGLGICASCALPVVFVTHAPTLGIATALIALAAAANQGWYANIYTFVSDIFPQKAIATVIGMGGMVGSISAMVFAESSGFILQATGSYYSLFVVCGSVYLIALAGIHLLVPQIKAIPLND